MSKRPQPIYWDTWDWERAHRETVLRKVQKIDGLRALLEMWEQRSDQVERHYLLALRRRLRSAENQLAAMQP